ncbi:hypothetical protein XBJ2_1930024 [Xenorhabdus bovienii str. Jollieti]|uniref:Uncharacterized protein n=1 Tax=Xenorhabdus bovienii (strain SS-2004) TaxID=406818 RepID=D3V5M6_XENBS|nr:hypothetical protein XBJ1_3837 [Xenorhabdus bovienii SS-2004]CDH28708.1 hypothetical protein XBJ2_1930024 [Xenorhabdus bovienii str. Jollieti]
MRISSVLSRLIKLNSYHPSPSLGEGLNKRKAAELSAILFILQAAADVKY